MLKNIKNYAMALAALAIAATTLASAGISKYLQADKMLTGPVWYEVQVDNPALPQSPSNLKITGIAAAPPNQSIPGEFCGTKNHFDSCMVRLDTDNLLNQNEVIGLTISEALTLKNAPVSPETLGDGYARSIEEEE